MTCQKFNLKITLISNSVLDIATVLAPAGVIFPSNKYVFNDISGENLLGWHTETHCVIF